MNGFDKWLLLAAACLLGGCGAVRTQQSRPAVYSLHSERHAGALTAEQEAWLEELCPFGAPVPGAYYAQEPLTLVVRSGYAILHNDAAKTPVWVCERVTNADVHGPLRGRDTWRTEPELCNGKYTAKTCARGAVDGDYTRSGYDRGHLAPNRNQRSDTQRKQETFYFSNAAPQVAARFNQSIWKAFEEELTLWVAGLETFWTITGVMYHDEEEEDPATADGVVLIEAIGTGAVQVPTHFYKIVVWESDQGLHSMAVVMKNQPYAGDDSFRNHRKSIDWLEERMDVDFMPELEPADADALETVIGTPFQ